MPSHLLISVTFLQPACHARLGKEDAAPNEWPPSPLRLFQAMVAGAAARWAGDDGLTRGALTAAAPVAAFKWLESLCATSPPTILAPRAVTGQAVPHYVPNNSADLVAAKWAKGDALATFEDRTKKVFRPTHLIDGHTVHYLWPLDETQEREARHYEPVLNAAARCIVALGWGIDAAVGDGRVIDASGTQSLGGERWNPGRVGTPGLRIPVCGTLDALVRRHASFLDRLKDGIFHPVPRLREFTTAAYRRDINPLPRPIAVFKLLDDNDDTVAYPHAKLIHISGMVRHLAIELMKQYPPRSRRLRGLSPEQWVRQYVAGHQSPEHKAAGRPHAQFSYVPLQSIGHAHTDPAVRRVMIIAPIGDEAWLEHLTQRLDGQPLKPFRDSKPRLPEGTYLHLIAPSSKDGVRDAYTGESRAWASVTPLILPGHDDHNPDKTRRLILKALAQSGIDQPCEFEWGAFSCFPKSYGAHKYIRDTSAADGKRRIGYIRPDHLLEQSAVHLVLRFGRREHPDDPKSRWIPAEQPIPGPIAVGAGRHCGFGVMATLQ